MQVHLVLPDRVLLGQAEDTAELHGYGPIPPSLRRLHATTPATGRLVAMDSRAWAFPDGIARLIRLRDRLCRTPWCDAPVRHVDHVQDHQDGGRTNETNGQGLCESCNRAKQAGRLALPDPTRTTTRDGDHHPYRPHLPIPSPRNLASSTSTGHDRLDLVFGASSGSPPERRPCRRPRIASDPWQPCCPSCS